MSEKITSVAVIGAGITGITTCAALQERGFDVTVFDRNRYAAMETSFANGGQLSASNAETWNRWATIFKGIKWMSQPGAPLLVNPKPSWHKYSWMAEFMAAIPKYRANTVETCRLAIEARKHLKRRAEASGFKFDLEERGILHVYRTKGEFDHAVKVNDMLAEGGLERRAVTPSEAHSIEPSFGKKFIRSMHGAFYTVSDFTGDIHAYARNLGKACAEAGADFRYGAKVDNLHHNGVGVMLQVTTKEGAEEEKFDAVVICAGVQSRDLAAQMGDRMNIYPVKGYSVTVQLDDKQSQDAAPWVSLLDDETKVVSARLGKNKLRIAGTAEFNGDNRDIRDDRIRPLNKWCEELFPDVSTEHSVPWAGLRPMMPDMMPRMGAGKKPGVFYNTGHGHLGWTLAAATAEIAAVSVLAQSRSNQ
jgi:D-amino-acid dehydrogenase